MRTVYYGSPGVVDLSLVTVLCLLFARVCYTIDRHGVHHRKPNPVQNGDGYANLVRHSLSLHDQIIVEDAQ